MERWWNIAGLWKVSFLWATLILLAFWGQLTHNKTDFLKFFLNQWKNCNSVWDLVINVNGLHLKNKYFSEMITQCQSRHFNFFYLYKKSFNFYRAAEHKLSSYSGGQPAASCSNSSIKYQNLSLAWDESEKKSRRRLLNALDRAAVAPSLGGIMLCFEMVHIFIGLGFVLMLMIWCKRKMAFPLFQHR